MTNMNQLTQDMLHAPSISIEGFGEVPTTVGGNPDDDGRFGRDGYVLCAVGRVKNAQVVEGNTTTHRDYEGKTVVRSQPYPRVINAQATSDVLHPDGERWAKYFLRYSEGVRRVGCDCPQSMGRSEKCETSQVVKSTRCYVYVRLDAPNPTPIFDRPRTSTGSVPQKLRKKPLGTGFPYRQLPDSICPVWQDAVEWQLVYCTCCAKPRGIDNHKSWFRDAPPTDHKFWQGDGGSSLWDGYPKPAGNHQTLPPRGERSYSDRVAMDMSPEERRQRAGRHGNPYGVVG